MERLRKLLRKTDSDTAMSELDELEKGHQSRSGYPDSPNFQEGQMDRNTEQQTGNLPQNMTVVDGAEPGEMPIFRGQNPKIWDELPGKNRYKQQNAWDGFPELKRITGDNLCQPKNSWGSTHSWVLPKRLPCYKSREERTSFEGLANSPPNSDDEDDDGGLLPKQNIQGNEKGKHLEEDNWSSPPSEDDGATLVANDEFTAQYDSLHHGLFAGSSAKSDVANADDATASIESYGDTNKLLNTQSTRNQDRNSGDHSHIRPVGFGELRRFPSTVDGDRLLPTQDEHTAELSYIADSGSSIYSSGDVERRPSLASITIDAGIKRDSRLGKIIARSHIKDKAKFAEDSSMNENDPSRINSSSTPFSDEADSCELSLNDKSLLVQGNPVPHPSGFSRFENHELSLSDRSLLVQENTARRRSGSYPTATVEAAYQARGISTGLHVRAPTQINQRAYAHPDPLLFGHRHPFRASSSRSAVQSSTRAMEIPATEEVVYSSHPLSTDSSSGTKESLDSKRRPPTSAESSADWLSTVQEGQSEGYSPQSQQGSFKKRAFLGYKDNITGSPHGTGTKEVGSSLAGASSPYVKVNSSPVTPGAHHMATPNLTPEDSSKALLTSTDGADHKDITLNESPTMYHRYSTSEADEVSNESNFSNPSINTSLRPETSSLDANAINLLSSRLVNTQAESREELAKEPTDWSAAYRRYLPPLGRTPQQQGDSSNHQNSSANMSTQDGQTSNVSSTQPLHPDRLPRYHNGVVYTDRPVPIQPHPVYGMEYARARASRGVPRRPIDRSRQPFARAESPHLYRHTYLETPESQRREFILSASVGLICSILILPAPFYGCGLLDRVMVWMSSGEFDGFIYSHRVIVSLWFFLILCIVVGAGPILAAIYMA